MKTIALLLFQNKTLKSKQENEEGLVLVYQMRRSIWAVHFLVFVYAPIALTAHVKHFAAVTISA
jgi:hypothetical protein